MKSVFVGLRVIFWLVVAALPLAIDRQISDFMIERNCMPGTRCLEYAMPLIVQVTMLGWFARVLLWPLALWHLGGRWLWQRYRHTRLAPSGSTSWDHAP